MVVRSTYNIMDIAILMEISKVTSAIVKFSYHY